MTAIAHVVQPAELARVERLGGLAIQTAAEERTAIDALTFIQTVWRNLERGRRQMVDPLNQRVSEVNAEFKALLDPVKRAEDRVKEALLGWRRAEADRIAAEQRRVAEANARREAEARAAAEQARVAAEAKARAEAAARGADAEEAAHTASLMAKLDAAFAPPPVREVAPAALPATRVATLGAATLRKFWTYEVTDEALVPRAYLQVDPGALRAAVNAGVREIEGVRIYQREDIAGHGPARKDG